MTIHPADDTRAANRSGHVPGALPPHHPGAEAALAGFNTFLDHRPDQVVVARDEADVMAAVRAADRLGIAVVPLGLGHASARTIDGGIAIATRDLARVSVDAERRTATVGAGAAWSAVMDAAAPHGLAPLAGSAPHVGVVGYLLGGGIGPVARTYGFAADHVRSLRVVTGSGDVLVATSTRNPDLFWALRGGKGGLGIVTEATIDLMPLATLQAGGIYYNGSDAAAVLHGFVDWARDLPESVSTSVAILRLPPLPELPEPLRGRTVAHLRVAVVGSPAEAEEVLAPVRRWAGPIVDTIGTLPYARIGEIHADPLAPMPVVEGGLLLRTLDHAAADALLEVVDPAAAVPLAAVELRLLGGAMARTPAVPNAVGGRDADVGLHVVGAPVPELLAEVVPATIRGLFDRMAPWADRGAQANFAGNANRPEEVRDAWPPAVRARLRAVRATHDPRGRFPFAGHEV